LHVADTSGHGVFEAAKQRGIYAFGAVSDQNKLAPSTVLTSFVIDIEKAFDQAVKMVEEDRFKGEIQKPGLESHKGSSGDGIVYIAPFYELEEMVPDDVKQRFAQIKEQILKGVINIPERHQENGNNTTDTTTTSSATTTHQ
jgi:basic membrane protein A